MKRKIYQSLLEWKAQNGKTALLIQGARRVGKSYIVEEFAKHEYKSYILIDFNKASESIKNTFNDDINDLDTFFLKLSFAYSTKLYERKSLIIFDEVQLFPRARSVIKYLVQDGRYDYIETGSLISIKENVDNILIPSEEKNLNMYPMDFEEFLWATNNTNAQDLITNSFIKKVPLGQMVHRKMMNIFRQYMIVGGMPQVVDAFINGKDFTDVIENQNNIINLYRNDTDKAETKYKLKIKAIFDELPTQLKNQNRHFKLSSLEQGAKFDRYKSAFLWLSDAMIVNVCFNSTEPNIGLNLNQERSTFKCYFGDTGLLVNRIFNEDTLDKTKEIYKKILLDKLESNLGMVVENVVAQMLVARKHNLFFYTERSNKENNLNIEIDFLISAKNITSKHNIIPIEVKSGKYYTLNSINKFKNKYSTYIAKPIVIHENDYKEENDVTYIPLYMTPLL